MPRPAMKRQGVRNRLDFMFWQAKKAFATRQDSVVLSQLKEPLMTSKPPKAKPRANPPPLLPDEQVLLRILVAQATQRGDTLARLAQALGVTYKRLAQWRRREADISRAHRSVHEKAAQYLGLPVVLVLTLAGTVSLADMVWPSRESLSARVGRELERLRLDPFLAAFVPAALATAEPAVQLLVAFLYRELNASEAPRTSSYHWLMTLHQAALGHADGQLALAALQQEVTAGGRLF